MCFVKYAFFSFFQFIHVLIHVPFLSAYAYVYCQILHLPILPTFEETAQFFMIAWYIS
jgi:hypothetical protein